MVRIDRDLDGVCPDVTASLEALAARLARFPRERLAHLPTPLEPLPRLGAETGIDLWVKRDDATGLAIGGNKVRKLEFLLGEAREDVVDTIITVGGVQSNHARQTAAACARLGLRCQLVLPRVVPRTGEEYEGGGNILLDHLCGAEIFVVADEAAAAAQLGALAEQAAAAGRRAVIHPPGGSTPTGCLGYVAAGLELREQLAAGEGAAFSRMVIAASTGGSLAGLRLGLGDAIPEIVGVSVAGTAEKLGADVEALTAGVRELLGEDVAAAANLRLTDATLGAGYGLPSRATLDAVARCASREGLLLDPVYTGKAMEALLAAAPAETTGPVLFWHTGGTPGLFAYRDAWSAAP